MALTDLMIVPADVFWISMVKAAGLPARIVVQAEDLNYSHNELWDPLVYHS